MSRTHPHLGGFLLSGSDTLANDRRVRACQATKVIDDHGVGRCRSSFGRDRDYG